MKKALMAGLAVCISMAFVAGAFAQSTTEKAAKSATEMAQEKAKAAGDTMKDKATKPSAEKAATPAAPEKAAPAPEKKGAVKAKAQTFKGEVTVMDAAAKTLTAKGKKGDMTFDVTDVKMKSEPKAGDQVMVKYVEKDGKMVAKSVSVKSAKKTEKKETKPVEKPAAPEKGAAPAPAPAK